MKTHPDSIDLILARMEYFKDFGIRTEVEKNNCRLNFLKRNENNDCIFKVVDLRRSQENEWVLERVDLSTLKLDSLKIAGEKPTPANISRLIATHFGFGLANHDIESITRTPSGWAVGINETSVRFKGIIQIQSNKKEQQHGKH